MGEIHELFVLALSLVWFAGATPDKRHIQDSQVFERDIRHLTKIPISGFLEIGAASPFVASSG